MFSDFTVGSLRELRALTYLVDEFAPFPIVDKYWKTVVMKVLPSCVALYQASLIFQYRKFDCERQPFKDRCVRIILRNEQKYSVLNEEEMFILDFVITEKLKNSFLPRSRGFIF